MQGSKPFAFGKADAVNVLKNMLLYIGAAFVTWGLTYLVPTLEANGGAQATTAIVIAALLKALERFIRDTGGTIDGTRTNRR